MQKETPTLTQLDKYFFSKFTIKVAKETDKGKRNVHQCFIDANSNYIFKVFSCVLSELNRLFKHFQENHTIELNNSLTKWLEQNFTEDFISISSSEQI